jgi:hypothetical protein
MIYMTGGAAGGTLDFRIKGGSHLRQFEWAGLGKINISAIL